MDRRRLLLIAAALVAALGAVLVFLYVQSADERAADQFDTVEVLQATARIEKGESIEDALAAGKVALEPVVRDQQLPSALQEAQQIAGRVALTPIYPGEQIIPEKFGAAAEASAQTSLQIPDGHLAISVNLTDPARVAGFVNPGSEVAVFLNGTEASGQQFTRLLLERVRVLGVGSTTPVSTTTTTQAGEQTTEQLPRTLLTLALTQEQAQRALLAQASGELAFALLTDESTVRPGPGVTPDTLF